MGVIAKIPEERHSGFKILKKISDGVFDKLNSSISKSPIILTAGRTAKTVSASISGITTEEVKQILLSVGSLIAIHYRKNAPTKELVDDVIRLIEKGEIKDLSLKKEEGKKFAKRLSALVDNEKLYYSVKGYDFLSDQANVFSSAEIISDIRPIFGEKSDELPPVAVISTILKIHYFSTENHHDIYLALDTDDIVELKKKIKEAENRIKNLQAVISNSGIAEAKLG